MRLIFSDQLFDCQIFKRAIYSISSVSEKNPRLVINLITFTERGVNKFSCRLSRNIFRTFTPSITCGTWPWTMSALPTPSSPTLTSSRERKCTGQDEGTDCTVNIDSMTLMVMTHVIIFMSIFNYSHTRMD